MSKKYSTESPLIKLKSKNPGLFRKVAESQEQAMNEMNKTTAELRVGGKIRYPLLGDPDIHCFTAADMAAYLRGQTVLVVKGEDVEVAERFPWWASQDDRRRMNGIIFEPDPKKAKSGALNYFTGFARKPRQKEGGYSTFDDHLLRNVCRSDQVNYNYALDILAHLVQRPGAKVGVALLMYGEEKGTGKSTVGEVMSECIGRQWCFAVDTPDMLTGKFNSFQAKALLICVEEAMNGRDPRHEARGKHMISGKMIMMEAKGIDAVQIESKVNYIFTSNKLNSVSMTAGERRYLPLHIGTDNVKDKAFFGQLWKEMENGGYEALMYDLLKRDISSTDFQNPPMTTQLSSQILHSMTGLDAWWVAVLQEGRLPLSHDDEPDADVEWPAPIPAEVKAAQDAGKVLDLTWTTPKELIQRSVSDFAGRDYQGRPPTPAAIGLFLASVVPGLEKARRQIGRDRQHLYKLPSLAKCRAAFAAARPGVLVEHLGGEAASVEMEPVKPPVADVVSADDVRARRAARIARFK